MSREGNSMIPSDAEFDRLTAGPRTQLRTAEFDGWIFKYVAVYSGESDQIEIEVNEVYSCVPSDVVVARAGDIASDLYIDLVDTILKFEGGSVYDLLERHDEAKGEDVL